MFYLNNQMSYTVDFVTDTSSILNIISQINKSLHYNGEDPKIFLPEICDLINDEIITVPEITIETKINFDETFKFYQENLKYLDDIDRNFGLIVARKDNTIIATIWLHFHDNYGTFIGIRSTIPYFLARQIDKTLTPSSQLLIPKIIEEAKKRNIKILYTDPLPNMHTLLLKYHGFHDINVNYDIKHIYGWNYHFKHRLSPENISIEREYSEKIGQKWDDSMANVIGKFTILEL